MNLPEWVFEVEDYLMNMPYSASDTGERLL